MSAIEKMLLEYDSQTAKATVNEKEVVAESSCDCCEACCNGCICLTFCAEGGCWDCC